jgi:hypothetical protein
VRNTVPVHDLGTTELQVGSINFTTEQLVDGTSTCEDNRLTLDLNRTLTKTDEISTDTYKSLAKSQE